jgi:transketolase
VAWGEAITRSKQPSALALSRQNLKHQTRSAEQIEAIKRGGYVLFEPTAPPQLILIATGSEVELAMQAARALGESGVAARVVSMPCTLLFDQQSAEYRESVLPRAISARVAIEAASADYWYKYVGLNGAIIGMQRFGASAPADALYAHFGFAVEKIVAAARGLLG